jgi:F420-dependent oxidoreductase-like protein
MKTRLKFGVQAAPEGTSWEELRRTWKLVEELGYDTAWTYDHFIPIFAGPTDPCLEGWITLAALAAETSRLRMGVLVSGNTYRHPGILAKMGATLDHTSGGRLIMGLGAAWYEIEHSAYGIPFYTAAERIRRLDEAAEIIKGLWTQRKVSFQGRFYQLENAYAEPKPLQKPYPPIMIGGGGEKLMLRVVAKHADIWNTFGSPDVFRHKLEVLRGHCAEVGRDPGQIEVSWAGTLHVTDSPSEKQAVIQRLAEWFGRPPEEVEPSYLVGSPAELNDKIEQFVEAGVTHFIASLIAPFHHPSLKRFAEELIPKFRD